MAEADGLLKLADLYESSDPCGALESANTSQKSAHI